jgi:hypothetical protein
MIVVSHCPNSSPSRPIMTSTINTSTRNVVDCSEGRHRHHQQPARHSDPIRGVPESVAENCGISMSSMISALTLDRDLDESFSTLSASRRFSSHLNNGSSHGMCSKPERNNSFASSSLLKGASARLITSMDLEGSEEVGCDDDTKEYETALAPAPDDSSLRFSTHSARWQRDCPGKPQRRGTAEHACSVMSPDDVDIGSEPHMNTSLSLEACLSAPYDDSTPQLPYKVSQRRHSRRTQFRLSGGSHAPAMTIDPSALSSLSSSMTLDSALFDTSTSGSSLSLGVKRFAPCALPPCARNSLSPLTKPIRSDSAESSKSDLSAGAGSGTQGEPAPPSIPNRRTSLIYQIEESGDSTDEEQSR